MGALERVAFLTVSVFVSAACLFYMRDVTQQREIDKWVKAQCEMALQIEQTPLLIARPEAQVGAWSALQYCLTKARLVHGASD